MNRRIHNEQGFSVIEMVVATTIMLIVTASVVSLVNSSMLTTTATYELTEAQQSLRTTQEFINRDLMNAGDGLKSMTYIPVRTTFVKAYLDRNPIVDATMPAGVTNLGILTTDNDVPLDWVVKTFPSTPVVKVRANTDRQTILEIDPDPTNVAIPTTVFDWLNGSIRLPPGTDMSQFTVGEIYFLTSARGGTFAALTSKPTDVAIKELTFGTGDLCELNLTGSSGLLKDISSSGALPTTLQRMRIIHYYVDSNGLLMRRVFGERGVAFRDSVIAEHVVSVQFVYSLSLDSGGNPVQPTTELTTAAQQVAISSVEVNVTVETPHRVTKIKQPLLSSSTSTGLRNMQFRQSQQPKASPTP